MSLSTGYSSTLSQPNFRHNDADNFVLEHLHSDARAVLDFWFDTANKPFWFDENDEFDQKIRDKFSGLWQTAIRGECASWRRAEAETSTNNAITSLAGRLAEIIVIDQFSRNLCRGQACAFAQDGMALVLAQETIKQPYFNTLPTEWRKFTIMPFMHSESAAIHERYLPYFEQLQDEITLDVEHRHKDIIDRFGRYPHRNDTLNRESTPEEKEFLKQPNSSF